jgi:hypothetical protein
MTIGEVLHFFHEYGLLAALLVVTGVIGAFLIWGRFRNIADRLQDTVKKIDHICVAISNDNGDPVVHHLLLMEIQKALTLLTRECESHINEAGKHYSDVERLASEEHWKNCDVSRCPNLQNILLALQGMVNNFSSFEDQAKESRNNTTTSLETIRCQISDLTRDILATLRVFKGGTK